MAKYEVTLTYEITTTVNAVGINHAENKAKEEARSQIYSWTSEGWDAIGIPSPDAIRIRTIKAIKCTHCEKTIFEDEVDVFDHDGEQYHMDCVSKFL